MAVKRQDFHNLGDDDDEQSNTLGVNEDSRFATFPNKRRRVDASEDEHVSSGSEGEESDDHEAEREEHQEDEDAAVSRQSKVKPLTVDQLEKTRRKAKKSGVIYISRVPPFMKPMTLRNLLTPYGKIGRIFLTPETAPSYLKRVKSGGNRKRSFLDGWVEFSSKRKAKACVELLNGNIIGGKKGGFYHDDLWNVKYLKGFKWSDLMEQVQGEEKMREGQLRAELVQEARERKHFQRNLERSKKERGMEVKRQKKAQADETGEASGGKPNGAAPDIVHRKAKFEREFKQNEVKGREIGQNASGSHIERLQSRLF